MRRFSVGGRCRYGGTAGLSGLGPASVDDVLQAARTFAYDLRRPCQSDAILPTVTFGVVSAALHHVPVL